MSDIQPELWVEHPSEAIAFYEAAFGAVVAHRVGDSEDIVAQLAVLLVAVSTHVADAPGVGGRRLRCACNESCWCKRSGLTLFRWVTPGRWHQIRLTP